MTILTPVEKVAQAIKDLINTHANTTSSSSTKGHTQAGGIPQSIGTSSSAGTDNGYYARADHIHTAQTDNIIDTHSYSKLNITSNSSQAQINAAINNKITNITVQNVKIHTYITLGNYNQSFIAFALITNEGNIDVDYDEFINDEYTFDNDLITDLECTINDINLIVTNNVIQKTSVGDNDNICVGLTIIKKYNNDTQTLFFDVYDDASYNNLITIIPTATSDLTNDSGFLTNQNLTNYVLTSDSRLSNARTPLNHTHTLSDIDATSSEGFSIPHLTARL